MSKRAFSLKKKIFFSVPIALIVIGLFQLGQDYFLKTTFVFIIISIGLLIILLEPFIQRYEAKQKEKRRKEEGKKN